MISPHVEKLTTHIDDRGDLTELIKCFHLPVDIVEVSPTTEEMRGGCFINPKGNKEKHTYRFGQVYVVRNEQPMVIRAFHRHKTLIDYFTVVFGKARIWLVSPEGEDAEQFILSSESMSRLTVPEDWWHGWQSLVPNTILISTATELYNKEDPDEERTEYDRFEHLGVYWEVRPK